MWSHAVERGDAHGHVGVAQESPEQFLAIRRVHVGEHQRSCTTLGVVGGCGEQASDCDGLGGRVVVTSAGQLAERQQSDVAVVVLWRGRRDRRARGWP